MRKNDNKPPEKEIYRLWWEYLKRSERYKFFCDGCESACKIDPPQQPLYTLWNLSEGGVSKGDAERGNNSESPLGSF